MTIVLLLSAALALPCRAVVSHGEAPDPAAPAGPVAHEFPTASVSLPAPAQAPLPQLPAALPAAGAAAGEAQPAPADGRARAGRELGAVSEAVAPRLEAAAKGADGDAASAGESIQTALQGGLVELKIYSDVQPPARDPRERALETSAAVGASFRYAYQSAADAAKKAKLGKPRFVEAWREQNGWQFHFVAGGRYLRVYARDGHQPADRAWLQDEWEPESSLGLTPPGFSQKVSLEPRAAIQEAARRLGVAPETAGLSLGTLPKSRGLWYVVDAEDGRRLALSAGSGRVRALDKSEVTRERVEASARALAGQKGYPFSQTEYNAAYAGYAGRLRQDGATRAQLALFARLAAALPVRGGRFNSWSGD